MIEKLSFWQGVLVGAVIGLKNLTDKEFREIQRNPYISPEQKMALLKNKYLSGAMHDCKTFDDLLKYLEK